MLLLQKFTRRDNDGDTLHYDSTEIFTSSSSMTLYSGGQFIPNQNLQWLFHKKISSMCFGVMLPKSSSGDRFNDLGMTVSF